MSNIREIILTTVSKLMNEIKENPIFKKFEKPKNLQDIIGEIKTNEGFGEDGESIQTLLFCILTYFEIHRMEYIAEDKKNNVPVDQGFFTSDRWASEAINLIFFACPKFYEKLVTRRLGFVEYSGNCVQFILGLLDYFHGGIPNFLNVSPYMLKIKPGVMEPIDGIPEGWEPIARLALLLALFPREYLITSENERTVIDIIFDNLLRVNLVCRHCIGGYCSLENCPYMQKIDPRSAALLFERNNNQIGTCYSSGAITQLIIEMLQFMKENMCPNCTYQRNCGVIHTIACRNPNCNDRHCRYYHPGRDEKMHETRNVSPSSQPKPNRTYENSTVEVSTVCKYGTNCTNNTCQYFHPNGKATIVCKYGKNCNNSACRYEHPTRNVAMCRYGQQCNRKNTCKFKH